MADSFLTAPAPADDDEAMDSPDPSRDPSDANPDPDLDRVHDAADDLRTLPDSPDAAHPMHLDDADLYQVSEESQRARDRKEQLVQQLLMKRRASALAVPTNDSAVRQRLRHLDHPITLFGEREMERRDRLRAIMAKLDADGDLDKLFHALEAADAHADEAHHEAVSDDVPPLQLFYTEGTPELLLCRKAVLKYSLPRAKARIEGAKRKRTDPDEDEDVESEQVLRSMADTSLVCSEIGDGRPLSSCAFSPDASLLATG